MEQKGKYKPKDINVGQHIRLLRTMKGLSQTDFGEAFAKFRGRTKPYQKSTVASWEMGFLPREAILMDLTEFLGCDTNELTNRDTSEFIEGPLTEIVKDSIAAYNGVPVWCALSAGVSYKYVHTGKWGIIDIKSESIIFSADNNIKFEDINFPIYTRPYPLTHLSTGVSVLTQEEAIKRQRVWFEPIGADFELNQTRKCWGKIFCESQSGTYFIFTDKGESINLSNYGVSFLCFAEPIDYTEPEVIRTPFEGKTKEYNLSPSTYVHSDAFYKKQGYTDEEIKMIRENLSKTSKE